MATVVPVITYPRKRRIRAVWSNLSSGDVGAAIDFTRYQDKTVQVNIGTLGSGVMSIEGSNDGVKWAALKEPDGTAITGINTDGEIFALLENPGRVRPNVGGTGGSGWTITLEAVAGG